MCSLPLISFQYDLRNQGNSSQATLDAHITCQTYRPKRRKEPLRESRISKWKDELNKWTPVGDWQATVPHNIEHKTCAIKACITTPTYSSTNGLEELLRLLKIL